MDIDWLDIKISSDDDLLAPFSLTLLAVFVEDFDAEEKEFLIILNLVSLSDLLSKLEVVDKSITEELWDLLHLRMNESLHFSCFLLDKIETLLELTKRC